MCSLKLAQTVNENETESQRSELNRDVLKTEVFLLLFHVSASIKIGVLYFYIQEEK